MDLPPEALQLKEKGNLAFKKKQYNKAIDLYTQALQLCKEDPAAVPLYGNRSFAHLHLQQHEASLHDAECCIQHAPSWPKGYYRAGCALLAVQRLADAAHILRQGIAACKQNAEIEQLLVEVEQRQAAAAAAGGREGGGAATAARAAAAAAAEGGRTATPTQPPPSSLDPRIIPAEIRGGHVFQVSDDGVNENLLLLLHGLGDRSAPYAKLAHRMALPQTASLALNGPLEVEETGGGRAWFEAFQADGELIQAAPGLRTRVEGLQRSVRLLQQLLHNLEAAGWPSSKVHIFGFSQGGTVVLEMARSCKGEQRLGGCVVVSSCILEELLMEHEGQQQSKQSKQQQQQQPVAADAPCDVVMVHGSEDDVVPVALAERSRAMLAACGCQVELTRVAGKGHSMLGSEREMRVVMAFWGRTLSYRPPGEELLEVK